MELLADLVDAVDAGRVPDQAALEEAAAVLEQVSAVKVLLRRRKAIRRVRELLASGEYLSVRAAAPRVAGELSDPEETIAAETVRWWWATRPVGQPDLPTHQEPGEARARGGR